MKAVTVAMAIAWFTKAIIGNTAAVLAGAALIHPKLRVACVEQGEDHPIVAAVTDAGEPLAPHVAARLMTVPGSASIIVPASVAIGPHSGPCGSAPVGSAVRTSDLAVTRAAGMMIKPPSGRGRRFNFRCSAIGSRRPRVTR